MWSDLTDRALGRYDIAVIGAEPQPAYNRVLLSSLLAGEVAEGDIDAEAAACGGGATRRDDCVRSRGGRGRSRQAARVSLSDGTILPFAKLVLRYRLAADPPAEAGHGPAWRHHLPRSRRCRTLRALATAARAKCASVIGGGLLGIEAAYGLAQAGVRVTLIHLMDRLMERQLDAPPPRCCGGPWRRKGVEVVLRADTARGHRRGQGGGARTDRRRA